MRPGRSGEPAQVLRVGAAERVDGLGVVTNAGQVAGLRGQPPDDVGLDRVDVLVFVHQHGVEHAPQHRACRGIGQRGPPQQQQIVEVGQAVGLLVRDVAAEQIGELAGVLRAPGEAAAHHLGHRHLGVHAAGVDVGADRGARRPALRPDQAVFLAARIQQVRYVGRIDDRELRRQRERFGVLADDPVRDGVERAASDPPAGRPGLRDGPGQHVLGGPAGEGQQQDPAGWHPLGGQPGRAGHQRARLPGAGPGQDQQGPSGVGDRPALFFVQPVQQARHLEHEDECSQNARHCPIATRKPVVCITPVPGQSGESRQKPDPDGLASRTGAC